MLWLSVFGAGVVVGVALILLLGGGSDRAPAVHAQGPAKAVQWEYCEVGEDVRDGEKTFYLATGATVVEERDWKALADKLKVKVNEDGDNLIAIFNHLGSQGWELCSATVRTFISHDRGTGGTRDHYQRWVFKRPRP
jgi:hypothetical protein